MDGYIENTKNNKNGPLVNKTERQEKRILIKNDKIYEILCAEKILIDELVELIIEYIYNETYIEGKLKYAINSYSNKPLYIEYPLGISTDGINIFVCAVNGVSVLSSENEHKLIWKENVILKSAMKPRFLVIYNHEIYVAVWSEIVVLNCINGGLVRKFNSPGCMGIAIYESHIYVSTQNHIIYIYTLMGKIVRHINLQGSFLPNYCRPTEISIIDDEIWIAGNNVDMIFCVSTDGKYKTYLDGINNGGARFINPYSVHATAKSIYVGDRVQIQQFTRNGHFIKKFGYGVVSDVSSMVFLNEELYVSDYGSGKVLVFE